MIDGMIQKDIETIVASIGFNFFSQLAGKTILLSGANGFVPSYLADTILYLNQTILRKDPAKLILLTRNHITKRGRLSHCLDESNVKLWVGDVTKVILPWTDKVDIIIHAASKASPKDYLSRPIVTAEVNVFGTQRLLDYGARKKVAKFLFISSGEIYGNPDPAHVPVKETYNGNVDPMGPRSAYQESKRFAETLCRLYYDVHGLNTVVARLFHTYGPRLDLDDGRVVAEFIRRALAGEDIEIVDSNSIRTFAYISDSVEALWRLLLVGEPWGQAYNIGSEEEITIMDLAKLIIKISGSSSKIISVPNGSIPHLAGTPDKTTPCTKKIESLGQINKVGLEEGIVRLIEWYKNQRTA